MTENTRKEIAALQKMTVPELRQRHIELFGEPNRSGNRQYLFRRIAWRLQAQAEGGLSERAKRRARELARDADIRMMPPRETHMPAAPRGLPTATAKLATSRDPRLPAPGTVLTRVFRGLEHHVTVLPNGFEYDGELYRSLTAIARTITGSHWNGFHFFGLARSPRKDKEDAA
ncbi:MAG: DUF2924 domain-containing protein [Phycisphaerales bacterium]|nr:DUF2924 domain-containing protein [Phycisphaerales bacterium]